MKIKTVSPKPLLIILLLMVGCSGGGSTTTTPLSLCQLPLSPTINYTSIPAIGSTENVFGTVSFDNASCDAQNYAVALYIHVPNVSPNYFCKPLDTSPLTSISSDGTWEVDYTTGGSDSSATEIVAFLVSSSFQGDCSTDTLPTVNSSTVLASISTNR